jgi:glycosyltransferase involved in cell wall biosynthesis
MKMITLSTVTPVYSGEAYLAELATCLANLKQEWEKQGKAFCLLESIFVLDGPIDNSVSVLGELARQWPWIHVVSLSKNFGQHPATMAGVLYTSGDWVVTLDEDLQHDPGCIVQLLRKAVGDQLDVVYASPVERVHSGWRDLASRGYKALMSRVLGIPHIQKFNSFRLLRGVIARASASVCSHETYFDMALCWFTDRIGTVEMPLRDRRQMEGRKSGYTLRSLIQHGRRLVISSHSKMLRVGAWIGGLAMLCSFVTGVGVVILRILAPDRIGVQGWASLILLVLFFGGLTSMLLSIVLEFLTNMSLHTQGKPTYFVVNRSADEIVKRSLSED